MLITLSLKILSIKVKMFSGVCQYREMHFEEVFNDLDYNGGEAFVSNYQILIMSLLINN